MQPSTTPVQGATEWLGIERRGKVERRCYSLRSLYCCLVNPRRGRGRRAEDRRYPMLDVFDSGAVTCVLLLVCFSILDAMFTLSLLARGGTELNPVMRYFLEIGPTAFMSAKMGLTTVPALILVASGNLLIFNWMRSRSLLAALVGIYAGLLLYEIGLLYLSATI